MEKYERNSPTALLATILAKLEYQAWLIAQISEETRLVNRRSARLQGIGLGLLGLAVFAVVVGRILL